MAGAWSGNIAVSSCGWKESGNHEYWRRWNLSYKNKPKFKFCTPTYSSSEAVIIGLMLWFTFEREKAKYSGEELEL